MEEQILEQVAKEFNLPKRKVEYIYSDWLAFIKETIRQMDLAEYTGQLGFMIPRVGKFYVDKNKLKYINQKKEIKQNGRSKIKPDSSQS